MYTYIYMYRFNSANDNPLSTYGKNNVQASYLHFRSIDFLSSRVILLILQVEGVQDKLVKTKERAQI